MRAQVVSVMMGRICSIKLYCYADSYIDTWHNQMQQFRSKGFSLTEQAAAELATLCTDLDFNIYFNSHKGLQHLARQMCLAQIGI